MSIVQVLSQLSNQMDAYATHWSGGRTTFPLFAKNSLEMTRAGDVKDASTIMSVTRDDDSMTKKMTELKPGDCFLMECKIAATSYMVVRAIDAKTKSNAVSLGMGSIVEVPADKTICPIRVCHRTTISREMRSAMPSPFPRSELGL